MRDGCPTAVAEAEQSGIAFTGRVITAGLAIVICVALFFTLGNQGTIKESGFGLAFAVFLDALLAEDEG